MPSVPSLWQKAFCMSTTTSAVLRRSSNSRFMRYVLPINPHHAPARPGVLRNVVDDDVHAVALRATVFHHRIGDGLAQAPLLLERTSRPHVNLHDRHGTFTPVTHS